MSHFKSMMNLQKRVKTNIHLEIGHTDYCNEGSWEASLITEQNRFPYWIRYNDITPSKALDKLLEFLEGHRPDHAEAARKPSDFLA